MHSLGAHRGPTAAVAALLLAGCGGSTASSTPAATSHGAPAAYRHGAPCVPAPIHHGPPPAWSSSAFSDSSPGFSVPYALASPSTAAAFFFAPTLRAGHPTDPTNKVLWVVRFPRNGHPLRITARFGADPSVVVRISRPADSSPGEIYPSYVDLPRAGCWHLELAWGRHRAALDVAVVRS